MPGGSDDWTPVRALGSHIQGTKRQVPGVVPFLKVVNDTAVAVTKGASARGSVFLSETWHLDIEEFLELRKNTGDGGAVSRHEHGQTGSRTCS